MAAEDKLITEWRERLSWANNKYKVEIEPVIDRNLRYYRGNHYPQPTNLEETQGWDLFVVNKVFSNIATILPAIMIRNPKAVVGPQRKPYVNPATGQRVDTSRQAMLVEALLNYFVGELDLRSEARRVLIDALIMPWGIMKIGYMPAFEKISGGGELLDVQELVRPAWPFWARWSPRNFRMDPEADRIENARWVAFRRLMSMEDIKANPAMKVPRDLKPDITLKTDWKTGQSKVTVDSSGPSSSGGVGHLYQRVTVWEIWDKKTGTLLEMAETCSKPLRNVDWPYRIDGFPCALLQFNVDPDEQVPIADVSTYLPQQDELNRLESLMLEHIRRHLPVYVMMENALADPEIAKLQRGLVARVLKATGVDARMALNVVQGAQLSPDIHAVRKMIASDLDEISSVTELERGTAARVDTATEATILQAATALRRGDRQAEVETFLRKVLRGFRQILQQTMEPIDLMLGEDLASKILGPEATELGPWLTVNREDIQGEFTESVEVGSSMPINEAIRKQDAVEDFTLMRDNPLVRQRELLKQYFEAKRKPVDKLVLTDQEIMAMSSGAGGGSLPSGIPPAGGSPNPSMASPAPQSLPGRLGLGGSPLANVLKRIGRAG